MQCAQTTDASGPVRSGRVVCSWCRGTIAPARQAEPPHTPPNYGMCRRCLSRQLWLLGSSPSRSETPRQATSARDAVPLAHASAMALQGSPG